MFKYFGNELNKEELLKHVSSMGQIAGTRLFKYESGKASGVKAVDVRAGDGLSFTILLDRGMDLGDAFYNGVPIGWKSKVGVIGPQYFENQGGQWLRNFNGLLTTCGLTQVGPACEYGGYYHALHGRISHTPAETFDIKEYWDEGDYVIKVTGTMREAIVYDENLTLTREVKCISGQKKIYIKDFVENEGYKPAPFMIMYHINQPYPIVSAYSRYYSSATSFNPIVKQDHEGGGDPYGMTRPLNNINYELYEQVMPKDKKYLYTAVINEKLKLGVYIKYDSHELPCAILWKMLGEQDYVIGSEPSNTLPIGIAKAAEDGTLRILQPRERIELNLEIGVVDGEQEVSELKKVIAEH